MTEGKLIDGSGDFIDATNQPQSMTEEERIIRQAVATVFGAVVYGMSTKDDDKAYEIAAELWPVVIDFSGYQVAKDCVLAMVGAFEISLDELAQVATIAKGEADA